MWRKTWRGPRGSSPVREELIFLKGGPRRRSIFAGEGARRRPAASGSRGRRGRAGGRNGSTTSRGLRRLLLGHGGGGASRLKSDLGWVIGLTVGLGRIPCGPNVSDTRIQHKTYLHFQDTAGNVSEMYPGRICIRNVSDTDTPPPRSIRVTECITAKSSEYMENNCWGIDQIDQVHSKLNKKLIEYMKYCKIE